MGKAERIVDWQWSTSSFPAELERAINELLAVSEGRITVKDVSDGWDRRARVGVTNRPLRRRRLERAPKAPRLSVMAAAASDFVDGLARVPLSEVIRNQDGGPVNVRMISAPNGYRCVVSANTYYRQGLAVRSDQIVSALRQAGWRIVSRDLPGSGGVLTTRVARASGWRGVLTEGVTHALQPDNADSLVLDPPIEKNLPHSPHFVTFFDHNDDVPGEDLEDAVDWLRRWGAQRIALASTEPSEVNTVPLVISARRFSSTQLADIWSVNVCEMGDGGALVSNCVT